MMPTVINGTGTWYYGKRRIYRRKGVCAFCNRVAELDSYDTTLHFTFFFVPLVPLGQKRILDACPYCRRHRVLPVKAWEASKAADIDRLLEKLKENPDDRDTIVSGFGLAAAYQDPVLLDKLADTLARDRLDDPVIQAHLGASYGYFARHAEAEEAYRASLAVQDDPAVRRQLALTLLKQGRPQEALPYLRHILDGRLADHAGLIFLLIEGYQAEGLHQEALDVMDQRDTAFPNLAATQECAKQRQTSERYLHSGKKVRSAYLSASPGAGYREGSWTAYIPRLIAPLILLGLLTWYLGAAVWIGRARQVYLVNGSDQPYTVAVNGREQRLAPGATPVQLPEGEVTVEFRDARPGLEPVRCQVETPFWSRPFLRRTFVINPDRVAVLVREQEEYADHPGQIDPPQVHVGESLYSFDGVDCPFTPFPQTVEVEEGHRVVKTRVGLFPNLSSEVRLRIASQALERSQQLAYARRLLDLNPNDAAALEWLLGQLDEADGLALLRPRLDVRPVLVDWHRAYETMMEKFHPEEDLRPAYRKLVAETGQHPDALYLLGRLPSLDPDEADRLLRQAAAAEPPSVYALNALGYAALEEGRFDEAERWTARAAELAPANVNIKHGYRRALLAGRQYDTLLEQLRLQQARPGETLEALVDMVRVYGLKGDEAQAQAAITQAVAVAADPNDQAGRDAVEASLKMVLCCARHDTDGFLEQAAKVPNLSHFEPALLRGKQREAAGLVDEKNEHAVVQRALLYLTALKAGDHKLADEQWPLLLAELDKGHSTPGQLGEILAGGQKPDVNRIRRLSILPEQKRVLRAVVARRYPETAKDLLPLARQLDFIADPTSLCLRKVLD
jgi:tetratricopeptide (TPR) repeat protein